MGRPTSRPKNAATAELTVLLRGSIERWSMDLTKEAGGWWSCDHCHARIGPTLDALDHARHDAACPSRRGAP